MNISKIAERVYVDVMAYRVAARPIKLDKRGIKKEANELARKIWSDVKKLPQDEPIGKYVINFEMTITNVVGETVPVLVVVRSNPSSGPYTVTGGGAGKARGGEAILIQINASHNPPMFSPNSSLDRELYKLLLHELSHIADKFKKTAPTTRRIKREDEVDPKEYYNKPTEVRAFMQEVVEDVRRYFPKISRKFNQKDTMKYSLNLSDTWNHIKPHLNRKNKNKILSAVWNEIQDLMD